MTRFSSKLCARGIASCAAVLCLLASKSLAIPNIESDGRLGSWLDFLTSLGYTDSTKSSYYYVYLDTDKLTAGVINWDGTSAFDFFENSRTELRQNVGRLVAQDNGPDIVAYDFTEIITDLQGVGNMPERLVLLGKRPAAIVSQGIIGSYDPNAKSYEELFLSPTFRIFAANSCDPSNSLGSQWPGTSPGGHGSARSFQSGATTYYKTSLGADGGYGGAGTSTSDEDLSGITVPGAIGGPSNFSWSVLQPGSPGGDEGYIDGVGGARGGPGGGAVLVKSPKSIALHSVDAGGFGGETRGGDGSGGHVIIDTPETLKFTSINVSGGPNGGGGGIVEFRRSPRIIGVRWVEMGTSYDPAERLGFVGLPEGVSFPASGASGYYSYYKFAIRPDSCPPIITINGSSIRNVTEGSVWVDEGASALDNANGSLAVTTSGSVNTAVPGAYEITYSAADSSGNTGNKKRCVNVLPAQPSSRDPKTGLPRLVAAMLRSVNSTNTNADVKLLPSLQFMSIDGQSYPAVTFLRRVKDNQPVGIYKYTWSDPYSANTNYINPTGLSYTFQRSDSLDYWQSSSMIFVQRATSRSGVTAPQGWEFATYRHDTPTSSAPRFYRVAIGADATN